MFNRRIVPRLYRSIFYIFTILVLGALTGCREHPDWQAPIESEPQQPVAPQEVPEETDEQPDTPIFELD